MGLLMYQRRHESFILSNEMQNKRPKYINMPPKFLLALEAWHLRMVGHPCGGNSL